MNNKSERIVGALSTHRSRGLLRINRPGQLETMSISGKKEKRNGPLIQNSAEEKGGPGMGLMGAETKNKEGLMKIP